MKGLFSDGDGGMSKYSLAGLMDVVRWVEWGLIVMGPGFRLSEHE